MTSLSVVGEQVSEGDSQATGPSTKPAMNALVLPSTQPYQIHWCKLLWHLLRKMNFSPAQWWRRLNGAKQHLITIVWYTSLALCLACFPLPHPAFYIVHNCRVMRWLTFSICQTGNEMLQRRRDVTFCEILFFSPVAPLVLYFAFLFAKWTFFPPHSLSHQDGRWRRKKKNERQKRKREEKKVESEKLFLSTCGDELLD